DVYVGGCGRAGPARGSDAARGERGEGPLVVLQGPAVLGEPGRVELWLVLHLESILERWAQLPQPLQPAAFVHGSQHHERRLIDFRRGQQPEPELDVVLAGEIKRAQAQAVVLDV